MRVATHIPLNSPNSITPKNGSLGGRDVTRVSQEEAKKVREISCKNILKMSVLTGMFTAMMIAIFAVVDFAMKYFAALLIPTLGSTFAALIVLPIGVGVVTCLMLAALNIITKCCPELKTTEGERI